MESSLSLDFLDYWRAPRGLDRTTASVMLGEWLLAVHQARPAPTGAGALDDAPRPRVLVQRTKRSTG